MDYTEVEVLVGEFLGDPDYNLLVADVDEWANDTTIAFEITDRDGWVQPNHDDHLKDVRARGKPVWTWEVIAILEYYVGLGRLQPGNYMIDISW
jgi:hypothetical protein